MDTKSIFASKTAWGLFLMAVIPIASWLGFDIADDNVTDLVSRTGAMVEAALSYGGFLLALWGRAVADRPLSWRGGTTLR